MLQLKNISKSYTTGDFTQDALCDVSLNFRENEFVAVLGQSGSGKTTLLNIVGGLDRSDSGELLINGKSTKRFCDKDWDAYRNNSVGFIFQSYNLITHLNILDNVEMGMTLSGVSAKKKHKAALEVLKQVGLEEHIHKKPNQLSGGQMQRVAIARALANDPDIILADEPTGALDSVTSEQIMDLIKEIAEDKLVIMVTHNPELAERYADRIIKFSDGKVTSDTNAFADHKISPRYNLKKTSMNFITALKLSGMNIATKKWRTTLTAFASSIGIIGIALILSLSNGFDKQIKDFEKTTLSNFPITISSTAMNISKEAIAAMERPDFESFPENKWLLPFDPTDNSIIHTNTLSSDYIDYVNELDPALLDGISYSRALSMNVLRKNGDKAIIIDTQTAAFSSYPQKNDADFSSYLQQYYDVLEGDYPKDKTDVVLVVDQYNRVNISILDALGFDFEADSIAFSDIIGTEFKIVYNDDFYTKTGNYFVPSSTDGNLTELFNSDKGITIKITGIIREKEDSDISMLAPGIVYSDILAENYIEASQNSQIVKAQQEADYNILNGQPFSQVGALDFSGMGGGMGGGMSGGSNASQGITKDIMIASLGGSFVPAGVSIYPIDFNAKEKILEHLDSYNEGKEQDDKIEYTDLAALVTQLSGNIMDAITMVLIAFAAISLVVSLIMIGIITYISVLERTKEIGVLRALGARKKDITRVFNAETFIIGTFSGILGIVIAYLLTIPTNAILLRLTELENVARLNPAHAIALIIISVILTMLGGFIPAKMAAKKDPVIALRTE